MEIEEEDKNPSPTKIENEGNQNPFPQEQEDNSLDQLNYLSLVLGLKINPEEFKIFQDTNELIKLINTDIEFKDKKKNEIKDTITEDISKIQKTENTSTKKLIEEKSKKFSDIMKHSGKTITYHTAEKDELSETMHAFYFCDKSKQIFSDKQAAEYRAMHFDPEYELPIPRIKEDDNNSSNSLSKFVQKDTTSDNDNNNGKLKKKRKNSTTFSKSKSNKKRKPDKNNANSNISVGDFNNNKNGDGEAPPVKEGEYCIINCKFGRKSRNQPMILCDKCNNWYHSRCLNFTNEEIQKLSKNIWYCIECEKINNSNKKI